MHMHMVIGSACGDMSNCWRDGGTGGHLCWGIPRGPTVEYVEYGSNTPHGEEQVGLD